MFHLLIDRPFRALLFFCLLLMPLSSCDSGRTADEEPLEWGYGPENGPDLWADLDPAYERCDAGTRQSPININKTTPMEIEDITFSYQPVGLEIENNGHTIEVNGEGGGSITVDGVTYSLKQFHFHSPSEHLIRDVSFDFEFHLVHESDEGLAVVGVLVNRSEPLAVLEDIVANLPAEPSATPVVVSGVTVDPAGLLPSNRQYYTYPGSLTTPPCSEGVKWILMQTPISLSQDQANALRRLYFNNVRPPQVLGDREVIEQTTPAL